MAVYGIQLITNSTVSRFPLIQSNLFNTDAKGTEPSVRFKLLYREVYDMVFLGPNELSVIERCPYYRSIGKDRLDCTSFDLHINFFYIKNVFNFFFSWYFICPKGTRKQCP